MSSITVDEYNNGLLQQLVANQQKPVLVTGADGYVAGVLVQYLLRLGFTVHATHYSLRDAAFLEQSLMMPFASTTTTRETQQTTSIPSHNDNNNNSSSRLRLFYADLMNPGTSFIEAMQNCEIVFHTASPFFLITDSSSATTADALLVQPAVRGTKHVLEAANQTSSVRRVVLTSSVGAMYANATETAADAPVTEECWNRISTRQHQPYFLSKTLAEQAAWVMAGSQTQWTLVVINPAMVLGPGCRYHASSESYKTLLKIAGGGVWNSWSMWFGCPNFAMPIVDVREVAVAHIVAALDSDRVSGRHIVSAANSSTSQIAQSMRRLFPNNYPIPIFTKAWWIPVWMVVLVAPYLRTGVDRLAVWRNMNRTIHLDHSKSIRSLRLRYRSVDETLRDMYQQLIDEGVVQPGPPPECVGAALVGAFLAVVVGLLVRYQHIGVFSLLWSKA